MNKPVRKCDVTIVVTTEKEDNPWLWGEETVDFYATSEIAKSLDEFGRVTEHSEFRNRYTLYVDPRFDFTEVLAYIDNLKKETTKKKKPLFSEKIVWWHDPGYWAPPLYNHNPNLSWDKMKRKIGIDCAARSNVIEDIQKQLQEIVKFAEEYALANDLDITEASNEYDEERGTIVYKIKYAPKEHNKRNKT